MDVHTTYNVLASFSFVMWPIFLVYALIGSGRLSWQRALFIWFLLLIARIWIAVTTPGLEEAVQGLLSLYLSDPWNTMLFILVGVVLIGINFRSLWRRWVY